MDSAQEEKHVADKMTENSWSSGEHFQIRHEDEEFGVYPAGLGIWSSIFSLCSIFSLSECNIYFAPLYVRSM